MPCLHLISFDSTIITVPLFLTNSFPNYEWKTKAEELVTVKRIFPRRHTAPWKTVIFTQFVLTENLLFCTPSSDVIVRVEDPEIATFFWYCLLTSLSKALSTSFLFHSSVSHFRPVWAGSTGNVTITLIVLSLRTWPMAPWKMHQRIKRSEEGNLKNGRKKFRLTSEPVELINLCFEVGILPGANFLKIFGIPWLSCGLKQHFHKAAGGGQLIQPSRMGLQNLTDWTNELC